MKCYCVNCNKEEEMEAKEETRDFHVRGIPVRAKVKILYCKKCGLEGYDYKIEKSNDLIINDEYKKKAGLLPSKRIKLIRETLGLTQEDMADLLHLGKKTITRYENGSIQDKAYDELLRLIDSYKTSLYSAYSDLIDSNYKNKTEFILLKDSLGKEIEKKKKADDLTEVMDWASYPA